MNKKTLVLLYIVIFCSFFTLYAQESDLKPVEGAQTQPEKISDFPACEKPVLLISENTASTLLALSDNFCVNLYDTSDFSLVCKFYDEKVEKISFYTEGASEFIATVTRNGQFIVRKLLHDEEGWHCEEGEPYFSADCADASGRKFLTAVSFSNNSDYVAAAFDDNSLQVHFRLRITAGSISHNIKTHKTPVYGLEFSQNGEYLASVSTDGEAYIWNSYTSSQITHISGIYARARVPVCFTADSVYIVSLESRNSFRISDFSGNTLYSILTGRPITAIKPLKDPDLIAVRNDKNEVMVYSISSRRPISIAAIKDASDFTSFEFDISSDLMYAGFSDGRVCLIEPQPYLDESSMLVTDSSLAGKKGGFGAASPFQSFSVCAGANYLTKPYLISADFRGEYLYSGLISPFFIGGGLSLSCGFPRKDFPKSYKINGEAVSAPKLLSACLYIPLGYAFSPWNNELRITTSLKAGAKLSSIALITGSGSAIGKPALAFFASIGAGMQIKFFTFDLNCEYDTIGQISPSLYAGYIFRWGEK